MTTHRIKPARTRDVSVVLLFLAGAGSVVLDAKGTIFTGTELELSFGKITLHLVLAGVAMAGVALSRRATAMQLPVRSLLTWLLVVSIIGPVPVRSSVVWLGLAGMALASSIHEREVRSAPLLVGLWVGTTTFVTASVVLDATGLIAKVDGRLVGLAFQPHMLGQTAGLALAVGLCIGSRRFLTPLVLSPLMAAAVIFSDARTIIVAVSASILSVVWTKNKAVVGVLAMVLLVVLAATVDVGDLSNIAKRTDSEDLTTFSGRLPLWEFSLEEISRSPLAGTGLASGPARFSATGFDSGVITTSPSAHSLPLDIARESGLVGLGLAVFAYLTMLRHRDASLDPLVIYLSITALGSPLTGFASSTALAWFIVLNRAADTTRATNSALRSEIATTDALP